MAGGLVRELAAALAGCVSASPDSKEKEDLEALPESLHLWERLGQVAERSRGAVPPQEGADALVGVIARVGRDRDRHGLSSNGTVTTAA
jgi:hypothetical protein